MTLFLAAMVMGILLRLPEIEPHRPVLLFCAALPLAMAWHRHRQRGKSPWSPLAGLLCGLLAAAWPVPPPVPLPPEARARYQTLEALVSDREIFSDMVRLTLEHARLPDLNWQAGGSVQLAIWLKEPTEAALVTALPGDRVRVQARLREPSSHKVPGAMDYAAWMGHNGIQASASAQGLPEVVESTPAAYWNRLREGLAARILEVLPPRQAGLAQAMLLGKRGLLEPELNEALQASGTYHLIAISGFHLALVAGWSFFGLRLLLTLWLPLSRRLDVKPLAALAAFPALLAYAAIAGWSIPTQRALLMTGLLLLSMLLGREHQAPRALGVAAILLLIWHPWQLLHAGFQLSFVAVALLLAVFTPPRQPLGTPLPKPAPDPLHPWLRRTARASGLLLFSTLLLGLALMPLTAHHFHRLAPYGLLANLVAIPLTSLITVPAGLLFLMLDPLFPGLGVWLLKAVGLSLEGLRQMAEWSAALPGAEARTPGPPLPGLAWYVALLAMAWMARSRAARLGLVLCALLGWVWPRPSLPDGVLHVAVLDVGQGQAVVVRTPQGRWSVLDAGALSTPRSNPGENLVSPYLWRYGVTALERVVVSHPQTDHMAGVERLLRNFPTTALLVGDFPDEERSDPVYRAILERAARRGTAVWRPGGAATLHEDGVDMHLSAASRQEAGSNLNNRSLVVALDFGAHRLLFPSDLEVAGERRLLKRVELGPVEALVAPHHGSLSSSSPELVARSRPRHVIFSVGQNNRFGFPKPDVEARWQAVGAQLWRTDRDGTVILESDGNDLKVVSAPWP